MTASGAWPDLDLDLVVLGGGGWAGQLTDWGVTIVVVGARETAMADRLAAAGWRSVYSDDDGSILVAPGR